MSKMTVRAVIFDLHGTIVEYKVNSKAARTEVTQFLIDHGIPRGFFSPNESYFEALNKLETYIKAHPTQAESYAELRKCVFDILDKYELENIESTCLIPGMLESLQTLRRMKLKLGLLTVNGQKATNRILTKYELNDYFQAVVTRELAPKFKPNPLHLEAVLKLLNVTPKESIVVGDSTSDIMVAHALKTQAIGVLGGLASKRELVNAGADYLSESPAALIPIIKNLLNEGN
jgi:HAD superfamily hydrolase (TIGR01509 family)